MKHAPKSREYVERLLAFEAQVHTSEAEMPAFLVCARLRPHLAELMGTAGFAALVARALTLASDEADWLRTVQVQADGTLTAFSGQGLPVKPEQLSEGGGALLIQLLGLLVEFIGEDLTVRLVDEAWPELSDTHLGNGVKHENGA